MKEVIDALLKLVDSIRAYPVWVQAAFAGWIFLGALLIVGMARGPKTNQNSQLSPGTSASSPPWPVTGDDDIDRVHEALNALPPHPTEAQVVTALRPLFYRALFFHIREERPESALYGLCRSQKLLAFYQGTFSSASTRDKIYFARTRMIKLQQQLEALFGSSFLSEVHCERFGAKRADYLQNLPVLLVDQYHNREFIDAANATLSELRTALHDAGLADRP
ncbi:MAG TPA: hypothetical protein VKK31_25470 [Thermoanaerobaculia bacterium]|nr:hypothetical protein [Thermoanaerobaculia bacterium]